MANVSAHIKGAAKQTATALKGLTGIYATLAKEHGEVSSLLKQALEASSHEKRQELLKKIRVEVLSHAKAEEATLYAALKKAPTMSPVIEHSQSEHQEMERLLDEVMKCAPGSEQQTSALGRLRQTIEHHAEEEEDRIFTQATDVLNNEQKKSLDAEFHALKQREKERLTEMSH